MDTNAVYHPEPPLRPELFELEPAILWVLHCAEGPVPRSAAAAISDFLRRETQPWKLRWEEDFLALPRATRREAARLLTVHPSDVTLTPTTSSGLVTVAQCFPWQPGDEVVGPRGEFPANVWPWKALAARGVGYREVPLWDGHLAGAGAWESAPPPPEPDPEDRLLAALSPRTRILAVSWVRFQDGLVLDLPQLAAGCAERDVALVVDGIQGAGTRPANLALVAAFATGGHKGLLAPQGLGCLWTDRVFRDRLFPGGSWLSVADATDFGRPSTDFDRSWHEDGTRLEQGVPNLLGCSALCQSLHLINEAGVSRIADHIRELRRQLLAGLAAIPAWQAEARRLQALHEVRRLGAIVALHHGGLGAAGLERILQRGKEQGICASVREGYLRLAFHGYHRGADVERLLAWLAGAVEGLG